MPLSGTGPENDCLGIQSLNHWVIVSLAPSLIRQRLHEAMELNDSIISPT